MTYDFETLVDRSNTGAFKWDDMKKKKPDLSPTAVPFSVADMEWKNPPQIAEGLKAYMDTHILGYTGLTDAYRQAVCGWMRERHGWEIQPEWIASNPGVVAALYSLVQAFTKPGEGVLVLTPVYYPFYSAVESQGRQVRRCPLLYADGAYSIDYDLLAGMAAQPDTTALIFCSPHNPVGRVWLPEELRRVAEICKENGVRILSDEIHFDLLLPGHRHTVFPTAVDWGDEIIVCTAPSKTFNLAAMSTSNIIIPREEDREAFRKAQPPVNVPALGLEACRIAYTQCGGWLDELLFHLAENYRLAVDFLSSRLPQIKPIELQGTYLLWLDCTALGKSAEELEAAMIARELFFDEGYVFGPEGAGFERLNIACPKRVLLAGLERFEQAVRSLA